jgi:ATP-dependent DNA helicase RecQ
MQEITNLLAQYWGYTQLRNKQSIVIKTILEHKEIIAILPTGAGKSLCFQISALTRQGLCLVICPTISLMLDQVSKLKNRLISAAAILSGMNKEEIEKNLENARLQKIKFLYISPERLNDKSFIEKVKHIELSFIVVDEAHCISTWGYNFRPSYLEIGPIRKLFPNTSIVALTATATKSVIEDIKDKLAMQHAIIVKDSILRKNIIYAVRQNNNKEDKLIEILNKIQGPKIIYVSSRKESVRLSDYLKQKKIKVSFYHAGLTNKERSQIQKLWFTNQFSTIVATTALGMGIDKPDVKAVIHTYLPESLEAYYQEAGRAGRNGQKAYAILLYNQNDIDQAIKNVHTNYPDLDYLKRIYQHLCNNFQIAVGSLSKDTYILNIEEFSKKYKIDKRSCIAALRILQTQELIKLQENMVSASQIQFKAQYTDIYKFQLTNPEYSEIINSLMKIGQLKMFSNLCNISETHLGILLKTSAEQIHKKLKNMEKLGLITYNSNKEPLKIMFETPRYNINNLPINQKKIEEIKEHADNRLQGMIQYATNQLICRNILIATYFEQKLENNCGKCDICIEQAKNTNSIIS